MVAPELVLTSLLFRRPLNGIVHWLCATTQVKLLGFVALSRPDLHKRSFPSLSALPSLSLFSYHIYLFMIDALFLSSICLSSTYLPEPFCSNQTPRYTQEANTTALAIEPSQPPGLLGLFHPTAGLATTTHYPQDNGAFYQPTQVFSSLDVRSRLSNK